MIVWKAIIVAIISIDISYLDFFPLYKISPLVKILWQPGKKSRIIRNYVHDFSGIVCDNIRLLDLQLPALPEFHFHASNPLFFNL